MDNKNVNEGYTEFQGDVEVLGSINSSETSETTTKTRALDVQTHFVRQDITDLKAQIQSIGSDRTITPAEKVFLKAQMDKFAAEHATIVASVTAADLLAHGVYLNYRDAYNALVAYMTPILADMNATTSISQGEYNAHFDEYFLRLNLVLALLNPTYQEIQQGFENAYGTKIPSPPVLTVNMSGRIASLVCTAQANLTAPHTWDFQVSEDQLDWYALRMDGVDWASGAVDGYTSGVNVPSIIHTHIPHDSGPGGFITGRTLFWRCRVHLNDSALNPYLSAWSNVVSATTDPTTGEDIGDRSIDIQKFTKNVIESLSFLSTLVWDFQGVNEGFTAANASLTASADSVLYTGTGAAPQLTSPLFNIAGVTNYIIRVKCRLSGSDAGSTWIGRLYWCIEGGHDVDPGYYIEFPKPEAFDQWTTIELDLRNPTAGGNDFITHNVTQLRLDFYDAAGPALEIDWIVVGKFGGRTLIDGDQIKTGALNTMFANVTGALIIGYAGSGTNENPQEGDRRVYIDNDEITFESFIGGKWYSQNAVRIGGSDSNGLPSNMISAMGIQAPGSGKLNEDLFPGGDVWDFENGDLASQKGTLLTAPDYMVDARAGVFGTNIFRKIDSVTYKHAVIPNIEVSFKKSFFFGMWFKRDSTTPTTYNYTVFGYRRHIPNSNPNTVAELQFNIRIEGTFAAVAYIRFVGLNVPESSSQTENIIFYCDEWNYLGFSHIYDEVTQEGTLYLFCNNQLKSLTVPTISDGTENMGEGYVYLSTKDHEILFDELLFGEGKADVSALATHYLSKKPWSLDYTFGDVIIKPNEEREAVVEGGLRVIGPLSAPNPIDPNDIVTVSGPRGIQGEVGPRGFQGIQGEPGFQTGKYDPAHPYEEDDTCLRHGVTFCSLTTPNTGNDPALDDGTNWVPVYFDSIPIGTVLATTFDAIPNGYLKFDGSIVPIADYPELYAAYGTKHGGDGITTFGLPNAQGLTLAGHGTSIVNGHIKGDGTLELLDKREDQLQFHYHKVYDAAGQSSSNGGYSSQTYYTNSTPPKANLMLEDTVDGGGQLPRGGLETHGPQLLVHYMVKARHATTQEQRDPNIDQRLTDVENTLTPAFQIYKTEYIDLSTGKNARALTLSHNLGLGREDLDVDVIWKRSSDGLIMSSGDNTYAGQSGYNFFEVNDLQLKFKHSNNNNSGIYYHPDTGVAHWNDLAANGFDLVKFVIKPKQVTGLKGEKGDPGVSTVPGPQGPQGPQGMISPNLHFLPELETNDIDVLNDKLMIYKADDGQHKSIHPKYLKGNYVTDIIGHNLYRQYILKMADGTYRFNCGSSCGQNMIGSNGRSDKVVHNQRWPLLYEEGTIGKTIKQIDARGWMAAVLFEDGDLYTIGYNYNGQLGVGDNTNRYVFTKSATNVKRFWLSHFQGYHSQHTQTFHEKNDGTIWGCGHNANYSLGLGNATNYNTWQQIHFFDDKPVIELYPSGCYHPHTVATTTDGSIWYAGYNGYGQCGDGSTVYKETWTDITSYWGGPTTGPAGNIVTHVAGHGYYGGAWNGQSWMGMLREDGLVRMCGDNDWGQLGNGKATTTNYYTPEIVDIRRPGTAIIANIVQLCSVGDGAGTLYARDDHNKLYRWGYNYFGQLGNGGTADSNVPYNSSDPDDIDNHCADILIHDSNSYTEARHTNQFIKDDRDNSIWGVGYNGEYRVPTGQGNGTQVNTFTRLAFDKDINIIKARQLGETTTSRFTIFLDDEGRAWFAGSNTSYQLNHYATSPTVPMEIDIK